MLLNILKEELDKIKDSIALIKPTLLYDIASKLENTMKEFSLSNLKSVWTLYRQIEHSQFSSEMMHVISNLAEQYESDFYDDLQTHSLSVKFSHSTNSMCEGMENTLMLLDSNTLQPGGRIVLYFYDGKYLSYLHPSRTNKITINSETEQINIITFNSVYTFKYMEEPTEEQLSKIECIK